MDRKVQMAIARVAQTGFQSSAAYEMHRPSYPPDATEKLLEVLEVLGRKGAKVLDLGAGTGKFTQLLAARPEGYEIVAVEPHDGMRNELERKRLKNVSICKGTAEEMRDVPDRSVDAVVATQAFHWFANMNALKEIHRVLKPRAVLGMVWNIEDYNAAQKLWEVHGGWEKEMRDVMWSLEDGYDRFRDMKWKDVFGEQGRSNPISLHTVTPLFGLPIGEETFDFVRWLSKDDAWKAFQTYSQVANLDATRLAEVEKIFWEAINAPDTETDDEGRVAVHGKTYIAWTSSIPGDLPKSG